MTKTAKIRCHLRNLLCIGLSLMLACGGAGTDALAQGVSTGEGGSITIEIVDPVTGEHVPAELLKKGHKYLVKVNAFDGLGNRLACSNPSFAPIQGVAGNQIDSIGADGTMTMGGSFGTAEVAVTCPELPNVSSKILVTNQTLGVTPPEAPPAPTAGGGGAAAVAVLAVVAGAAALAVAAGGLSTSDSNSGGTSTQSNACAGNTRTNCCTSNTPGASAVACAVVTACGCPSGTTDTGATSCGPGQPFGSCRNCRC